GEGLLHRACRAAAERCVLLCLQRESAYVAWPTSRGLTPLHCLALSGSTPTSLHLGSTLNVASAGSDTEKDDLSSTTRPVENQSDHCGGMADLHLSSQRVALE
ncbi:unnamed protein product, partial [Sphacelaria rigidula]